MSATDWIALSSSLIDSAASPPFPVDAIVFVRLSPSAPVVASTDAIVSLSPDISESWISISVPFAANKLFPLKFVFPAI